jgi:hypothetical protein
MRGLCLMPCPRDRSPARTPLLGVGSCCWCVQRAGGGLHPSCRFDYLDFTTAAPFVNTLFRNFPKSLLRKGLR